MSDNYLIDNAREIIWYSSYVLLSIKKGFSWRFFTINETKNQQLIKFDETFVFVRQWRYFSWWSFSMAFKKLNFVFVKKDLIFSSEENNFSFSSSSFCRSLPPFVLFVCCLSRLNIIALADSTSHNETMWRRVSLFNHALRLAQPPSPT